MNSSYLEAYEYYKGLYAPNVILFHVGYCYECYEDDAECLAAQLDIPVASHHLLRCLAFPDSALQQYVALFLQADIPLTIVEYRLPDGTFAIPKVKQIIEDENLDY